MKKNKIIYLIIGIFCLYSFASCSSQLDDMYPKGSIPQDKLTDSDIDKLLNGNYAEMEELVFNFYLDGDIKGENFQAGPGFSMNDPVSMASSDKGVLDKWQKSFTVLKQINFLLETCNEMDQTNATVQKAMGTAHYFRALIYYQLVIRWGGVPIMRERSYDKIPISPEVDIWNFIMEDLEKAEKLLPDFSDKFYVSISACDALFAKVHLALKNYEKAAQYADKVIATNKFSLAPTSEEYAKAFIYNTTSKEIVFALANRRISSYLTFYQSVNDIDATWDYAPSSSCFNNLYSDTSIKEGDKRSVAVFGADDNRLIKFPNGGPGQFIINESPSQSPIVVIRIAEMYLIKAEALGNIEGLPVLKEFMENRYATLSLPSTMNEKDFQDLILDERRREFYGEGQRWYDLKRTNRLDLFETLNGREYLMYFPVPQSEIDLAGEDKYPQNPGYN